MTSVPRTPPVSLGDSQNPQTSEVPLASIFTVPHPTSLSLLMVTLFTWRAPFSKSTRPQVKLEGLRDRLNSDGFFLKKKKEPKKPNP
jgi:hypothetical protein